MKRYTKIIQMTGYYFTKEFEKKASHKNKIREVKEETVARSFLQGDTEILVHLQENNRKILITPSSSLEDIKKYLGNQFIK
jgi:hypothetical protein